MHGKPGYLDQRAFPQAVLWLGVLIALALLLAGAGFAETAVAEPGVYNVRDYGAKGDGVTDDYQAITNAMQTAAAAGQPLYFPAGTYLVRNQLSPPDGVTLMGAGPTSVLYMPESPSHSLAFIFNKPNPNNVTIRDFTLRGDGPAMHQGGLHLYGARDSTLKNLRFENLWYGMKLGGADRQAQRWTVEDITATNNRMPMYIQNVEDSTFARMSLEGVRVDQGLDHSLYMSASSYRLTFTDVTLLGGGGYGLHLYSGYAGTTSSDITFNNLTIDAARQPMAIADGFSNIYFNNLTTRMSINEVQLRVSGCNNVVFDGITASGGYAFIGTWNGGHAGTITIKNGNYNGPVILSPYSNEQGIANVVVQNVTVGASSSSTTLTTQPPTTTTTTVAPTTTTLRPLVTTTTLAPTTTTTIPPVPPSGSTAQVSISSPANGSVVQGNVDVRTTIKSAVAVGKVRLYVDGRLIATDYRAPYAFTWNTKSAVPGSTHTVASAAYGASGLQIGTAAAIVVKVASSTSTKLLLAAAAAPPEVASTSVFPDLTLSSPYGEAVLALAEAGVVAGFEDGHFGADSPVTRAQVVKMAARTLGIADGDSTRTPFVDLDPPDADLYPHKYIAALFALGAVEGTSPDQFSPYDSVSRAQLVTIAVRALRTLAPGALGEPPAGFVSSMGDFNPSHEESMRVAEYNGLLEGLYGYGSAWDPWAPATRGEVAQILHNLTISE